MGVTTALNFDDWHPPVEGDVRGPCPGLNALANHNIIPHDGKKLSPKILVPALTEAYNISPDLATFLAVGGLRTSPNPLGGSFDLDNLGRHNIIEHDGSLSRGDFAVSGDDASFRPDLFATVLSHFDSKGNVTLAAAAAARHGRVTAETTRDPGFELSVEHKFLSYGETALYLLTMVNPETGATPTEFVRILFEEERLPYKEGWRPPKQQLHTFTFASTILQLALATHDDSFTHNGANITDTCMLPDGGQAGGGDFAEIARFGERLTHQLPLP